jgi:hypothetical protein
MSKQSKQRPCSTVYVGEIAITAGKARGRYRIIVHDRRTYNDLVRAFRRGNATVSDMKMAR